MRRTLSLVTLCLLGGCNILAPIPNPDRYYTLTADGGTGASSEAAVAAGTVYGLGPVKLPAYLDRNEIAMRISPTEVRYSNVDRWAETLSDNINSVLVQNLTTDLGTNRIVTYPWPHDAGVIYQVEITFTRFEVDTSGVGRLAARWVIRDPAPGRYLMTRDTVLERTAPPGEMPAAVAALSSLLADLSGDIATALRGLPAPSVAPGKPASR